MPFTEDLSEFLSTTDFATAAVFSGNGATVNVIFDANYRDPLGIEATGPQAVGAATDFPSVVHNQTLTINSVAYKIVKVEPVQGFVTMKLRKP